MEFDAANSQGDVSRMLKLWIVLGEYGNAKRRAREINDIATWSTRLMTRVTKSKVITVPTPSTAVVSSALTSPL